MYYQLSRSRERQQGLNKNSFSLIFCIFIVKTNLFFLFACFGRKLVFERKIHMQTSCTADDWKNYT